MGYKTETIKGTSWLGIFRIVTRILAYLKIAVLARILTPAQFGVFGIATIVLAFLEMLTETGINVFLIQTKRPIHDYLNSAWIISIVRGGLISLLLLLCTPLIVAFFNEPDAYNILLFMSVVPFLRGFINPAVISYQKELRFEKEFWFRSSIFFVDTIVSIIVALATSSVYSLVWGLIAGVLLEVILSFALFKERPKLHFIKRQLIEIFHAGKWVTGYGIFNYIAQELDTIVVGKVLGASSLGMYQMAYRISTIPLSEVTDVVSKVVFPVYSKIENDRLRLKNAFVKSTSVIIFVTTFIGIIIYLFPEALVKIILGDQWLSVVPVLKILAIYGVLRAIMASVSSLFLGVGKQQYITVLTFVRFIVLTITIYPFVIAFGLTGAAFSAILSVIAELPFVCYYLVKVFAKSHLNKAE